MKDGKELNSLSSSFVRKHRLRRKKSISKISGVKAKRAHTNTAVYCKPDRKCVRHNAERQDQFFHKQNSMILACSEFQIGLTDFRGKCCKEHGTPMILFCRSWRKCFTSIPQSWNQIVISTDDTLWAQWCVRLAHLSLITQVLLVWACFDCIRHLWGTSVCPIGTFGPDYTLFWPDYSTFRPDCSTFWPDYSTFWPDYSGALWIGLLGLQTISQVHSDTVHLEASNPRAYLVHVTRRLALIAEDSPGSHLWADDGELLLNVFQFDQPVSWDWNISYNTSEHIDVKDCMSGEPIQICTHIASAYYTHYIWKCCWLYIW